MYTVDKTKVLHFNEIHDYAAAINLNTENKFSDFLVYDYKNTDSEACIQLSTFRRNYFEIALEVTDSCSSLIDQFELPAVENRLVLISPHRLQTMYSHTKSDGPHRGYGIFFKPEFIYSQPENRRFIKDFPFFRHLSAPFISLEKHEVNFYKDIIQKILTEYQNSDIYSRNIIRNYLNILLMKARQHYPETRSLQKHAAPGREREIYDEFSELVQSHFSEIKSVQEYAQRMYISPKHLSETVKNVSGKSALEIIHQAQLNYAKALLRQTHKTVAEIAYELNFENPEYFSVFFKRLTGENPSQFRIS